VSTFGVLSAYDGDWVLRVLRRCVTAGYVGFAGADRPVVRLTGSGARVMRGELSPRLVLPPLQRERAASRAQRAGGERRPEGGRGAGGLERTPAASGEASRPPTAAEQALFEALRAHRLAESKRLGVPPYVVAPDRTLHDLARQRPRTREDLLRVDGIGPARAERFGDGWLAVVSASDGEPA
jgi:ATP-dependent DNA helicase RecQ